MKTRTTECKTCLGHGSLGYDPPHPVCTDCGGSGEVAEIVWPDVHTLRHLGTPYIVETEQYADGVGWTCTYLGIERSGTSASVEAALRDAREWVQVEAMGVAS